MCLPLVVQVPRIEHNESDNRLYNTHHVKAATLGTLDNYFIYKNEDNDDETYVTHLLGSRMSKNVLRRTLRSPGMDFHPAYEAA